MVSQGVCVSEYLGNESTGRLASLLPGYTQVRVRYPGNAIGVRAYLLKKGITDHLISGQKGEESC